MSDAVLPLYSVVTPVYNGAHTLPLLHSKLVDFFTANQLAFELIYVYDCGTDNSWDILLAIKQQLPNVVTIVKPLHNTGQHSATFFGLSLARGKFIITLDEDLQHPPEEIGKLIFTQQQGNYDLVYGAYIHRQHTQWRNFPANMFALLLSVFIPGLPKQFTSFRLFTAQFAQRVLAAPKPPYLFIDGLFALQQPKVGICPVLHQAPHEPRGSAYNFTSLAQHALGILTNYTPLLQWIALFTAICLAILTINALLFPFIKEQLWLFFLWLAAVTGLVKWVLLKTFKKYRATTPPYLPTEKH